MDFAEIARRMVLDPLPLLPVPVEQLSEEARFALCVAAGVPCEWSVKDGVVTGATKHLCGVALIDGQYRVYQRVDEIGEDKNG